MEWIAGVLATPQTVIYLILALLVLAFSGVLKFRSAVKRVKLPLKAALGALEGNKFPASEFMDPASSINGTLRKILSEEQPLRRAWDQYTLQLENDNAGGVVSYASAERFFNSTRLLQDRWIPLCRAVPGYLVGIGLVFTFLGIAVVIYRASIALGSDHDLQSLRDLLGAASLKFWTSLAGVALSVITSAYQKHLASRFAVTVNDFCHALDSRITVATPERSQYLAAVIMTQQLTAIKELKAAVSGTAENDSSVISELRDLRSGMTSVTENTFNELVAKSTEGLATAITASLEAVAGTFVRINGELEAIVGRVEAMPQGLDRINDGINNTATSISTQLAAASSSSASIASDFDAGKSSAESIRTIIETLPVTMRGVTESLERLSELGTLSHSLSEASAALRSASDSLLQNLGQQEGHIKSANLALGTTVAGLPAVFTQYSDSLRKFTEEFDNHLGSVLTSMGSQIQSLNETQSSLAAIASSLHAAIADPGNRTADPL